MKITVKFLLLPVAVMLLVACQPVLNTLAGEVWEDGAAYTTTHWRGDLADATMLTFITATNEAEWQNLWQRVGQAAPGKLPSNKMGVAVLVGQRPSAGYNVSILAPERTMQLGALTTNNIRYTETAPPAGSAQAQILTSPWAIRLVDRMLPLPDFERVN